MRNSIPFDAYGQHGPVLHFAHANAYPPGCYRQLLTSLEANFRVLAMHQRPLWPGSQPEAVDDWRVFAADLQRFCKQQGLGHIIGIGHSLGAVATMMAALAQPDLFRALVLIEPVFLPPELLALMESQGDELRRQDLPLVQTALRRRSQWPSRQAAFDHFRSKRVFRHLSDSALQDFVAHGLVADEAGEFRLAFPPRWEARIYGLIPTAVWRLIPQVSQPILGLRGEYSDTLSKASWNHWQQGQPQATFVEVADSGHLLPLERPVAVSTAIRRFVADLPGRGADL
ncbi:MAG: alpha/beta hydrolase [Candidatus Promineifilaceae bacterium]|nr:alpha/beta hydrolase [Candidatus Promineifilaceae bacterium]